MNSQNFKFYSRIIRDSGWHWKPHVNAKCTGFNYWKCSWSKATINIRFTLAKWHDKPKNTNILADSLKLTEIEGMGLFLKA